MSQKQVLQQQLKQTLSPQQLLVVGLLECPILELENKIQQELEENPALEEGVVPGGGITFYRIAEELGIKALESKFAEATTNGYKAVLKAICKPIEILAANSNVAFSRVERCPEDKGVDFKTRQYVDMLEAGIIDPAKALRVSIEHAVAAASLLLNTKCIIP